MVGARGDGKILDPDTGDVMRYSMSYIGRAGVTDDGHSIFDLSKSGFTIVDHVIYGSQGSVKFAAILDMWTV